MSIPSVKSFEQIIGLIKRANNNELEIEKLKVINACIKRSKGKNYTGSLGHLSFFLKKGSYESNRRENLIGNELNELRNECHNFLYTCGILNIKVEYSDEYLITEFANGKPLNELCLLVINPSIILKCLQQILLSIDYANKKIGFVHRDLIASNVVITSTNDIYINKDKIMKIGDNIIYTDLVCQIFDFDKSHTNKNKYDNDDINNNILYDVFTIIYSCFFPRYKEYGNIILKWWGFPEIPEKFEIKKNNPEKNVNAFLNLRRKILEGADEQNFTILKFLDFCDERFNIDIRKPSPGKEYENFKMIDVSQYCFRKDKKLFNQKKSNQKIKSDFLLTV